MAYLYFDSAATARPLPEAIDAAGRAYTEYGNPSSLHSAGLAAKRLVDTARTQVAAALHCKPERIVFVSSGTEANNQRSVASVPRRSSPQTASILPWQSP